MALSPPYPAAANAYLAVPTPAVSVATTPVFDTLLRPVIVAFSLRLLR